MTDIITLMQRYFRGDPLIVDLAADITINRIIQRQDDPQRVSLLWFGDKGEPRLEAFEEAGDNIPTFFRGFYQFGGTRGGKAMPTLRIVTPVALWMSKTWCIVGIFEMSRQPFDILNHLHEDKPLGQTDVLVSCEMMGGRFPKYAAALADGSRLRQALVQNVPLEQVFEHARLELAHCKDVMRSKRVKP